MKWIETDLIVYQFRRSNAEFVPLVIAGSGSFCTVVSVQCFAARLGGRSPEGNVHDPEPDRRG